MNATATANAPHFLKFAVERCIRIVTENGEHCLPVDARQSEEILRSIAHDDHLNMLLHDLQLIQTQVDGETFALMTPPSDDLYRQALDAEPWDETCNIPEGSYGGVVWRVLGYLSDRPDDVLKLQAGNDEAEIRRICAVFQQMLDASYKAGPGTQNSVGIAAPKTAPIRAVVNLTGGAIHEVLCEQALEIVFLSHDDDDIDDEQQVQGYKSIAGDPVALWKQESTEHEPGFGAKYVEHYFDEFNQAISA